MNVESRAPSGLFPSGPPRPTFREPHQVRLSALFAGAGVAAAWMLVFGLVASSVSAYLWLTLMASIVAWGCALVLARLGDRGVAAGVAIMTSVGLAAAMAVLVEQWVAVGWPLW